MSVEVTVRGGGSFGQISFDRDTAHTMSESASQTAEQFAQELERIAAELRRMFPPETTDEHAFGGTGLVTVEPCPKCKTLPSSPHPRRDKPEIGMQERMCMRCGHLWLIDLRTEGEA